MSGRGHHLLHADQGFATGGGLIARLRTLGIGRVVDRVDRGLASGGLQLQLPDGSLRCLGFRADGPQATVQISISGATNGYHGVHIHANGDCANNDAGFGGAAGGHWNPTDAGHGFPTGATHHAGDLGNILVTNGTGATSVTTTTIKLTDGDALNPIGKAVIFHQGTDDGTTQPTGDAGTRAACGILQKQ